MKHGIAEFWQSCVFCADEILVEILLVAKSLDKMKYVALSEAKGLYNSYDTLTALACSASVGRDKYAPSERHKLGFATAMYYFQGAVVIVVGLIYNKSP